MTTHTTRPDRRAFGRRPSSDQGIARIPGRPPVRCQIKNISQDGALLDFGAAVWLPFTFRLVWEAHEREEVCDIKHQNGQFVGISFRPRVEKPVAPANSRISLQDSMTWMAGSSSPARRH